MKKLLALILFLPMLANAQHHRLQAIDALEIAKIRFLLVPNQIVRFETCCDPLTASQLKQAERLFHYVDIGVKNLQSAIDILNDPSGDLNVARRFINDPKVPGNNKGSMSGTLYALQSNMQKLMNMGPYDAERTKIAVSMDAQMRIAWRFRDGGLWHINDAIREEVYNDPDFQ